MEVFDVSLISLTEGYSGKIPKTLYSPNKSVSAESSDQTDSVCMYYSTLEKVHHSADTSAEFYNVEVLKENAAHFSLRPFLAPSLPLLSLRLSRFLTLYLAQ